MTHLFELEGSADKRQQPIGLLLRMVGNLCGLGLTDPLFDTGVVRDLTPNLHNMLDDDTDEAYLILEIYKNTQFK